MSKVNEYLANVSATQRVELERIRNIVRQAVPEAEEVIAYGMPGFKYKTKYLIGFAAFKNHMSVFPASTPIEVLKEKLHSFGLSKGTIQFTAANPIPKAIIQELVAIRVRQITTMHKGVSYGSRLQTITYLGKDVAVARSFQSKLGGGSEFMP